MKVGRSIRAKARVLGRRTQWHKRGEIKDRELGRKSRHWFGYRTRLFGDFAASALTELEFEIDNSDHHSFSRLFTIHENKPPNMKSFEIEMSHLPGIEVTATSHLGMTDFSLMRHTRRKGPRQSNEKDHDHTGHCPMIIISTQWHQAFSAKLFGLNLP